MAVGDTVWVLGSFVAFLLGSLPFGRIIGMRVARIDVTKKGSGNIGATNVAREVGLRWGILTLLLDALKGFLPVVLLAHLYPHSYVGISCVGVSTLLGHQFSLFLRLRGGKGVATALGVLLAIAPLPCLGCVGLFVLVVYLTDFVSLGSMISASAMPLVLLLSGSPGPYSIASLIMAGLIVYKHKDNIQRLLKGEERRWRGRGPRSGSREGGPVPHQNNNG